MSSQPQCPKCAAQLKDDYGMVECPSCGIFVFVDMDGIAHISEEADEPTDPIANAAPVAPPPPAFEPPPAPIFEIETEIPAPTPADEQVAPPAPHEASVHGFTFHTTPDLLPLTSHGQHAPAIDPMASEHEPHYDDQTATLDSSNMTVTAPIAPTGEPTLISPDQTHELGGELDMDALLGFNEPAPAEPPPEEFGAPGDPLGLNEYANSELSQAKDGLLTFKILISGIDSKEMRETLRSALDDQRFGWNPSELISRISKGVLQIDNVASVKAVILINRIKRMPVKVRWEQYAITKMESH